MSRLIRSIVSVLLCGAAMTGMAKTAMADPFFDAATTANFMRDLRVMEAGGSRTASATTSGGQKTGIAESHFFAGADFWNNERNEVLGGIQYVRREFDREIAMPGGFNMPKRIDNVSTALIFKHITSGDWSLTQGVRYTQYQPVSPSVYVREAIDLVGVAAVSTEPGVAWVFGYVYDQADSIKPKFYPVLEYVNAKHEQWSIIAGFPILNLNVAPHPDWGISGGGGLSVIYKVTQTDLLSAAYGGSGWAYRFEGPGMEGVAYKAQRVGLGWTSLFAINHHAGASLSASVGWEFKRRLGPENDMLDMGRASVVGINAGISF